MKQDYPDLKRILTVLIFVVTMIFSTTTSRAISPTQAEFTSKVEWSDVHFGSRKATPPFAFTYDGKPSAEFIDSWQVKSSHRSLDVCAVGWPGQWAEEFQVESSLKLRVSVTLNDKPQAAVFVYQRVNNKSLIKERNPPIANMNSIPLELFGVTKKTTQIEAFLPSPHFDRHDPSNIIQHGGCLWVFYTRNVGNHREVSVHFASSVDGYLWTDLGEALGSGNDGDWDESGTIAPYIVSHKGKFYLFYTGFRDGNLATRDLGCAISDQPEGPWIRWRGNPILRRNPDPVAWDSGMLGDANVFFRQGKWWLYFKSRRETETSEKTHIGVATADEITGPYHKHPGNPLFAGHAFSAWLHRDGVAALCGKVSLKIKWSPDGLHFLDAGEFYNQSTGLFTPDTDSDHNNLRGFEWGLEVYTETGARGLRRFDCALERPDKSLLSEGP